MSVEVGQVLVLKIKFNNSPGIVSPKTHPYLVINIDTIDNKVEIAQFDSLMGKEVKAARKTNKVVYCDCPPETVIDKDSFVQLDNTFRIENGSDLERFRRQPDKLSKNKLDDVLKAYTDFHNNNTIDPNKCVDMTIVDIMAWNK